jgi:hypothetical protein
MRIGSVSASALILSAFALSACTGSGVPGLDTLNIVPPCSLNDPCPSQALDPDAVPPDTNNPTDPDAPPNTNIGNPTKLSTGDTTIALESAVLKSPATGSLSKLTLTSGAPNTAKFEIDTKTKNNKNWPKPKVLDEYVFGSGTGLGSTDYKEYRRLDADEDGTTIDETLQVWNWTHSYGTQYREVAGGGDARRQAWSFGGTRTPVMQTGGTANYTGSYGATANTWNWIEGSPAGKTISANNIWRVEGTTNLQANFTTRQLDGTLTPSTWTARQTSGANTGAFLAVNSSNPADPNFAGFMDDNVVIKGTITGNTVTGKAYLDPAQGWLNGTNPMYAGFFGDAAVGQEVTGVYNFLAASPEPVGGEPPINDDGRGFVHQSGVFNGSCALGPACP